MICTLFKVHTAAIYEYTYICNAYEKYIICTFKPKYVTYRFIQIMQHYKKTKRIPSLKLTTNAPENRPKRPQRKHHLPTHPFSDALAVSFSVPGISYVYQFKTPQSSLFSTLSQSVPPQHLDL